jgi:hypothetical protein
MEPPRFTLTQRIRDCRRHNIIDQTGVAPGEVAIYTLSDPRDVRLVRYVGQTRNPPSRLTQHLHAARLWLPDELPWWIRQEELRPLYTWIRELHGDGGRLPAAGDVRGRVDHCATGAARRAPLHQAVRGRRPAAAQSRS